MVQGGKDFETRNSIFRHRDESVGLKKISYVIYVIITVYVCLSKKIKKISFLQMSYKIISNLGSNHQGNIY